MVLRKAGDSDNRTVFEDDEDRFKDGEFRRDAGEKRVKILFLHPAVFTGEKP